MKATNYNFLMVRENDFIFAVNDASRKYGDYVCQELGSIGIRCSYLHIMKPLMDNVKEKNDKGLTQLELVKITNLKAPTISITLRTMERDGIVRREKNDADRRETHVFITDKGKKMYGKVLDTLDKAEKTMLKGLSDKELKAMRVTLDKMSANLNAEIK